MISRRGALTTFVIVLALIWTSDSFQIHHHVLLTTATRQIASTPGFQTKSFHDRFSHQRCQTNRFRLRHLSSTTEESEAVITSATSADVDAETDSPLFRMDGWTKATVALAVPAWIGMMSDPLLSLMDTAFVGRVGTRELAALGACTSIFHLAFNVFRATTAATTSLVASAPTPDEKRKVTGISLALGVMIGLVVMRVLQIQGPWALARMGIAKNSLLFDPAYSYLSTRLWAAPAVLCLVVSEGAFRGYGDTRIPLLASLVASLINMVLDPVLMFGAIGWGVMGAAAATAISQFGAAVVYTTWLLKRKMLPSIFKRRKKENSTAAQPKSSSTKSLWGIVGTILGANLAMCMKQGSLLLGWAFATSKATRLGPAHVAAHQVALSFWLVFALWLDGAGVAGQVLISQLWSTKQQEERSMVNGYDDKSRAAHLKERIANLTKYMMKTATLQGLFSSVLISILGIFVPTVFTKDPVIRLHLRNLMPDLVLQQTLISWTLVMESLAVGTNAFRLLAFGNILSTILSVWMTQQSTSVSQIWSRGIVSLFAGRLFTALIAVFRANEWPRPRGKQKEEGGAQKVATG